MKVADVQKECCAFLKERLSPSFAVATCMLANRLGCEDLEKAALEYISANLDSVASDTPERTLPDLDDRLLGLIFEQCDGRIRCTTALLDFCAKLCSRGVEVALPTIDGVLAKVSLKLYTQRELFKLGRHALVQNRPSFLQSIVQELAQRVETLIERADLGPGVGLRPASIKLHYGQWIPHVVCWRIRGWSSYSDPSYPLTQLQSGEFCIPGINDDRLKWFLAVTIVQGTYMEVILAPTLPLKFDVKMEIELVVCNREHPQRSIVPNFTQTFRRGSDMGQGVNMCPLTKLTEVGFVEHDTLVIGLNARVLN